MSSSEEIFDIDNASGSESDDYEPVPKTKKSAAKAPAKAPKAAATKAKAPPKSHTKPKKQVLRDIDANANESLMEVDAASEDDMPAPKAPVDSTGTKKSASETYQKLSPLEHILKRPDSYIGSVESITQAMWVYDSDTKRMVHREVSYVPGFFKIVDEVLVNAADNKINDPNMDTLKIDIDVDEGKITIYNNGKGIPIEVHSKEGIYIPEMIFGHLLTSSNYNDDEKKLTGGRNGYGAKLANIYSTEFTVETADKKKKYVQTWTQNMGKAGKAKISNNTQEYTRIGFKPDLPRFGLTEIDEDTVSILKKRVYDLAGTVSDVKVFLNGERLKIKNFKHYVEMYLESATQSAEAASGGAAQAKPTLIHEKIGDRWEIAFAVSEGSFQHVSFANSISTFKGGTHVNHIADQIIKNLTTTISKKNKAASVKPAQIKNHMWIFVKSLIENPTFDSQTKEQLTLPASKFGSKPTPSDDFLKKIAKTSIIDNILNWAKFKADQQAKKTDGSKRNRLTGMVKLSDANNAGTRHASKCTLILTEGDSAKALAIAGLSIVGRDNFGVFPLRGKLLNVREAKHDQIMKNEEIQNVKKILGLQHNKVYNSVDSLRYGSLMIMTDQDHDGSHIKGLVINFLDHFYPSLLQIPNFLVEFVTPIVRVTKGKQLINFFTIPEYEKWSETTVDSHKWTVKYYKGLGTSKDTDGHAYFSQMEKHMIPFAPTQEGDRDAIDLAFSKKKADDRKEWLRQLEPGTYLDHDTDEITYQEFINKELILFSMADNVRSIPSVADGLKPGQRKVIWSCFRRNLKSEIKVAQLVGYVSEHSAYHHGEASLMATIINLAQTFVGSNNINLLKPNGQFGTREQGGKDAASARYIFTEVNPIARRLLHPADDALLPVTFDDGKQVEPEYYLPTVPLILINGAEGIGTGWSTNVPSYNPADIVANIRRLMAGEEMVLMTPWWRGFKGTFKKTADNKYDVTGLIRKLDDKTVEITELPIHKWTQVYKAELESMVDTTIKDYKEHHDTQNVHFVVTMGEKGLQKAGEVGLTETFKLTSKLSSSNMICFDFNGKIKKYSSPEEIIEDFYPIRLGYYQKRKDHMANELQTQLDKLNNQARFVQMIVKKELVISNRKKTDIVAELRRKDFKPFPKVAKAKVAGETEPVVEAGSEDEDRTEDPKSGSADFDYLLGMPIWNLTAEKIAKLLAQAKGREDELMQLLARTPIEIWNEDLDLFLADWQGLLDEWQQGVKSKPGKKKQATLRTRKSIGKGQDDDSEDDFKPTKAAARATTSKATAKRPAAVVPSATSIKLDSDDEEVEVMPKKKRRPVSVDSDNDSKASETITRKVSGTSARTDAGEDMNKPAVSKPSKGKSKAPAKRKSLALSDDEDDDLYVKPAKKAKAASAAKQTNVEDFFAKPAAGSSKQTKSAKMRPKSITPQKKKTNVETEDGEDEPPTKKTTSRKPPPKTKAARRSMDSDSDNVPAPAAAPRRATARTGAKKTYVEIGSDEDEDGDNEEPFVLDSD